MKATFEGKPHSHYALPKFRRSSAAVATSREGHRYTGPVVTYDPAFTHTMMRGLVAATLGQVTVLSLM